MDTEKIRSLAQQILAELPRLITTPTELDLAQLTAVPGDVLTLSPSLVYPAPFTLRQSITLQSQTYLTRLGVPMTADEPAPRFLSGFTAQSDAHALLGLDIRHTDPTRTLGVMGGNGGVWDRMRLLGDPVNGARRGINFTGANGTISNPYIDDIFWPSEDTQAIYSQEMLPGGGLTVSNGFLRAAGEVVMFGGGDALSEAGIPRNITFTDCVLTKRPEWMVWVSKGKHVQQVKGAFELKDAIGVRMTRCHFEGAGVSAGQGAYLLVFTPRNQGGHAPWSTVQDVVIENCTGRLGSGVCSMLGSDDTVGKPSGPLSNLTIRDCAFTDIDPLPYHGDATGRILNFNNGPDRITVDGLTVEGANLTAHGYFQTQRAPTKLALSRIAFPATKYGWKLDGNTHPVGASWPVGTLPALMAYMPDLTVDATVK